MERYLRDVWVPDKKRLVKVALHDRGKDVETVWAEDVGAAQRGPGRLVRLGNVPFVHAKPTYGDLLVVEHDPALKWLAWDANGVPFNRILTRIAEDGGRYAVIVDYEVTPRSDVREAFKALDLAGEWSNIAVEGLRAPRNGKPGRAYLAVPYDMKPGLVLKRLRARKLPMSLTLVHPL